MDVGIFRMEIPSMPSLANRERAASRISIVISVCQVD